MFRRHGRFIVVFVVATAVAFAWSVWARGIDAAGVLVAATVGLTLGVVAVPELISRDSRDFRYAALWQTGWAVVGSVLVAYQLGASGEGYAVAVVLGGLLGWSAPFWIEHMQLP